MKKRVLTDGEIDRYAEKAIRFAKYYPCVICPFYNSQSYCIRGIKYRGTCKIRREILRRLLPLETEDKP